MSTTAQHPATGELNAPYSSALYFQQSPSSAANLPQEKPIYTQTFRDSHRPARRCRQLKDVQDSKESYAKLSMESIYYHSTSNPMFINHLRQTQKEEAKRRPHSFVMKVCQHSKVLAIEVMQNDEFREIYIRCNGAGAYYSTLGFFFTLVGEFHNAATLTDIALSCADRQNNPHKRAISETAKGEIYSARAVALLKEHYQEGLSLTESDRGRLANFLTMALHWYLKAVETRLHYMNTLTDIKARKIEESLLFRTSEAIQKSVLIVAIEQKIQLVIPENQRKLLETQPNLRSTISNVVSTSSSMPFLYPVMPVLTPKSCDTGVLTPSSSNNSLPQLSHITPTTPFAQTVTPSNENCKFTEEQCTHLPHSNTVVQPMRIVQQSADSRSADPDSMSPPLFSFSPPPVYIAVPAFSNVKPLADSFPDMSECGVLHNTANNLGNRICSFLSICGSCISFDE